MSSLNHLEIAQEFLASSTFSRAYRPRSTQTGEFVALVGPSGCGKSTLLAMIAGLETISSGEIRIDGRLVNSVAPKDRDIAMVFQSYALYPTMTVRQNITFGMESRGVPRAEQDAAVKRTSPACCRSSLCCSESRDSFPAASVSAHGDGPGVGARPQAVPVRRAAFQPRRQAAGRNAFGDQEAPPTRRQDDDLCRPHDQARRR